MLLALKRTGFLFVKVSHGFGRGGHGAELAHGRGMRRFEKMRGFENALGSQKNGAPVCQSVSWRSACRALGA